MRFTNFLSVILRAVMRAHILTICLLAACWLSSCRDDDGAPDVSGVPVKLNVRRFDRDLASADTAHIAAGLQSLQRKYPDFLAFWLDDLMQFNIHGAYADATPGIRDQLHTFLTYKDFRGLFDTVAAHFPDTKIIEAPLSKGFQYYNHYYPQRGTPKIVYFISGLNNWSVVTVDTDIVGIGLDMFLGERYPFYKSVGIPDYIARNLVPESAPVKVFKALYEDRRPFEAENRTLLDMMVQRGKEQYFLSKMLPFLPDSTRFGFTAAQTEWCGKNETLIYNFFVKQNFLYEKNWGKILRYVNDAPEATGMPPESPGNVGSWLGWRIVKAYADRHPQVQMEALFALPDAQAVLQEAQYKPH